jgi:transposase-like protein
MTQEAPKTTAAIERVRISCPGCGRNDVVSWPVGQEIFHWKCFNCSKQFDLTRKRAH